MSLLLGKDHQRHLLHEEGSVAFFFGSRHRLTTGVASSIFGQRGCTVAEKKDAANEGTRWTMEFSAGPSVFFCGVFYHAVSSHDEDAVAASELRDHTASSHQASASAALGILRSTSSVSSSTCEAGARFFGVGISLTLLSRDFRFEMASGCCTHSEQVDRSNTFSTKWQITTITHTHKQNKEKGAHQIGRGFDHFRAGDIDASSRMIRNAFPNTILVSLF